MICNFIIGIPQFAHVIGDENDWLQFYGNYLGSIISSGGAFVILYITITNSRHEQILELRHKEILYIQDDLAKRIGAYNVSEIIRLNVYSNHQKITIWEEATRLQSIHDKYSSLLYSARLMYGNPQSAEENKFFMAYQCLLCETVTEIKKLILFLTKVDEWNENCRRRMLDFSDNFEKLSIRKQEVVEYAYNYLQSEIKKYQEHQTNL